MAAWSILAASTTCSDTHIRGSGCGRGSSVTLVMELSPFDMQALDRYEEVDEGMYRRERVAIEAWACGPRPLRFEAETYVAGRALDASTDR